MTLAPDNFQNGVVRVVSLGSKVVAASPIWRNREREKKFDPKAFKEFRIS